MIRVTQHVCRRGFPPPPRDADVPLYGRRPERGPAPGVCIACGGTIQVGDTYRQLVAVGETDAFNDAWVRWLGHEGCVSRAELWELRRPGGPQDHSHGDPLCEYVRARYKLDVQRGSSVLALGKPGRVVGGTNHVWVRLDGARHPLPYHPHDVVPVAA